MRGLVFTVLCAIVSAESLASDIAALTEIYVSGGGPQWKSPQARSTWLNPSKDACQWFGVTCAALGEEHGVRVVSLALSGFGLTMLSAAVGSLTQLRMLDVSENGLDALPEEIGGLAQLTTLWCPSNRLTGLPGSVQRLTRLTRLSLKMNLLREVPAAVTSLVGLENLYLNNNEINSLPEALCDLRNLTQLLVNNNNLQDLPDNIGLLSSLSELYLHSNRLRSLPMSLSKLTALRQLYLYINEVEAVPELGGLVDLEELLLHSNRIVEAPEVSRMTRLWRFSLANNPLSFVPSLAGLVSLRELYLSTASLTSVPALPPSLVRLDLNNNSLTRVEGICGANMTTLNLQGNVGLVSVNNNTDDCLPALVTVNLSSCNLTSLAFLARSSRLTSVDVGANPVLGNAVFTLTRNGAWPRLQSLGVASSGVTLPVAGVLGSVFGCKGLLTLDVSGNPEVGGDLTLQELYTYGGYDGRTNAPYSLLILRLDGIGIGLLQNNVELLFPLLRILSLRDAHSFAPEVHLENQQWLELEEFDVRGAGPGLQIRTPVRLPGSLGFVDIATNSTCPSTLLGGVTARYKITLDPRSFNWSHCQCLSGHYGQPWDGGCRECPDAPEGETGVAVDCFSSPGVLKVTGGWFVLEAEAHGGAVVVVPCPSDSPKSPCSANALVPGGARPRVTCARGYEGRLCSRCAEGFFRSGRSCYPCGAAGLSWLNPLLSVVILTALGVRTVAGGFSSRSGLIRTLTIHAQLVALLPGTSLRLTEWSGFLIKASGSGSGGLRLEGLECAFGARHWDGFFAPFAQAALLPMLVAVGSVAIGALSGLLKAGKAMGLRERVGTASMHMWLVLLFGSMQKLLSPLNCTRYGEPKGESSGYLTVALWVSCSGGRYKSLLTASLLLGLGYTFGTIGLVVYRLRPSTKGTSSISSFLRSPYTADSYYWEAVQLLRRVALAMTNSLTKLYSPVQPVIVSSVLILSLLAHTWRKPYLRALDNVVESISLTLLLSSYMAGLIASNPRFPPAATTLISWLFFSVNAVFLLALTATVLLRSVRSSKTTTTTTTTTSKSDKELSVRLLQE